MSKQMIFKCWGLSEVHQYKHSGQISRRQPHSATSLLILLPSSPKLCSVSLEPPASLCYLPAIYLSFCHTMPLPVFWKE